jgi:hypothetical protein
VESFGLDEDQAAPAFNSSLLSPKTPGGQESVRGTGVVLLRSGLRLMCGAGDLDDTPAPLSSQTATPLGQMQGL